MGLLIPEKLVKRPFSRSRYRIEGARIDGYRKDSHGLAG